MRKTLVDLVARMTTPEPRCTNSADSISWHAHREAEALADPSTVDELGEYVQSEPDKKRRKAGYFILGKLGQKLRGYDCASVLLARVSEETDKYVLSRLLEALGEIRKPESLDLRPVFPLLQDKRWLVRHSAIRSLIRADSPEAESQILHALETMSDPFDITYCQATLSEIGRARALPFLEKNLTSRNQHVKESARWAVEAIKRREKTSV